MLPLFFFFFFFFSVCLLVLGNNLKRSDHPALLTEAQIVISVIIVITSLLAVVLWCVRYRLWLLFLTVSLSRFNFFTHSDFLFPPPDPYNGKQEVLQSHSCASGYILHLFSIACVQKLPVSDITFSPFSSLSLLLFQVTSLAWLR